MLAHVVKRENGTPTRGDGAAELAQSTVPRAGHMETLVAKRELSYYPAVTSASTHLCRVSEDTPPGSPVPQRRNPPPWGCAQNIRSQTISSSAVRPTEPWLCVLLGHAGGGGPGRHPPPPLGQTLVQDSHQDLLCRDLLQSLGPGLSHLLQGTAWDYTAATLLGLRGWVLKALSTSSPITVAALAARQSLAFLAHI